MKNILIQKQENDDAWFNNWQDDEFLVRSMMDLKGEIMHAKKYLSLYFVAKTLVEVYGLEDSEKLIAKIANECRKIMKN